MSKNSNRCVKKGRLNVTFVFKVTAFYCNDVLHKFTKVFPRQAYSNLQSVPDCECRQVNFITASDLFAYKLLSSKSNFSRLKISPQYTQYHIISSKLANRVARSNMINGKSLQYKLRNALRYRDSFLLGSHRIFVSL